MKQAKSVAWDYLRFYGLKVPGASINETELRLDLPNGGRVRLYGSDNPDALRGEYLDGLVLDEAADTSPRVFNEILRPSLTDRSGWAVWIGTPKGMNDFHDLWQEAKRDPERYFTLMLRASQTGIIPRDELDDARRSMTQEQYEQEFEGSFTAAIIGAYYGKEMQKAENNGRIAEGIYDPSYAVHTAWDLGISDHTVVWFAQVAGFQIRLVDCYAANGYGLDHYAGVLQDRRYRYGRHYFPHDVAAREIGSGRTRVETLQNLGVSPQIGLQRTKEDSINAVRRILPRCAFDRDRCAEGIKALRQYRREWDDVRKVFVERPLHDWCFTGDTEVLTRHGTCQIKELPQQGEVLTPCGFKPYHSPRITRRSAPLVGVAFSDGLTVRCTPEHLFMTGSGWKSASDLRKGSQIQSCSTRSPSTLTVLSTAFIQATSILRRAAVACIRMFGGQRSVPSQSGVTSIIGMALSPITSFQTLSAWKGARTYRLSDGDGPCLPPQTKQGQRQLSGTALKRDGSGTPGTRGGPKDGPNGSVSRGLVSSAVRSLMRWFGQTDTSRSSVRTTAALLTIEGVSWLDERADVWCLTVPGEEAFALANGAVVHNCSHFADAFAELAAGIDEPMATQSAGALKKRDFAWVV